MATNLRSKKSKASTRSGPGIESVSGTFNSESSEASDSEVEIAEDEQSESSATNIRVEGDDSPQVRSEADMSRSNLDSGAGLMNGGTADHSVNSLKVSTAQDQAKKGWNNPKKRGRCYCFQEEASTVECSRVTKKASSML